MSDDTARGECLTLRLKELLQIAGCPARWRALDLYVFRDEAVVFYVGQSYTAFDRVWRHFYDGFKARSAVGRLILCNWPESMHWTIDLLRSDPARFPGMPPQQVLDAAERELIEELAPCLNEALNPHPTPLPARYRPLSAPLTCARSPSKLIREAAYVLRAEERRRWLEPSQDQEG